MKVNTICCGSEMVFVPHENLLDMNEIEGNLYVCPNCFTMLRTSKYNLDEEELEDFKEMYAQELKVD